MTATTPDVNLGLAAFAKAVRSHDVLYHFSDDGRVYARESTRREMLALMARGLVDTGTPMAEVLAVVEIHVAKYLRDHEVVPYLIAFRDAVEAVQ